MTVASVLARRRAERDALLATATAWAATVGPVLGAEMIVVAGSVARGDFNKWSDIDVLVVADGLPDDLPGRLAMVDRASRRPPGLQAIAWTPAELARRRRAGTDPIAREVDESGVVVYGALSLDR